jgi:hypothetical protein
VLLQDTEPQQIISFIGQTPRRLVLPTEKQSLQEALRRLTALDLLQADHVGGVLYVEDESDHKILREWANVLQHRALPFLQFPYVVPLRGKGNLDDAKRHFQYLRLAKPDIKGLCVVDRDSTASGQPGGLPTGLGLRQWGRYEIENYLLLPDLLKRFVRGDGPTPVLEEAVIDQEFAANFPAGLDYLSDIPALRDLKASDFIVNLLNKTSAPLPKRDLFMLAGLSRPDEVHPDVRTTLDAIAGIMPGSVPSIEANVAPMDTNGIDEGPTQADDSP